MISDARARTIASYWHGGQESALYSFMSTGAIDANVAKEVLDTRETIGRNDQLSELWRYLMTHEGRGPVEGWGELWEEDEGNLYYVTIREATTYEVRAENHEQAEEMVWDIRMNEPANREVVGVDVELADWEGVGHQVARNISDRMKAKPVSGGDHDIAPYAVLSWYVSDGNSQITVFTWEDFATVDEAKHRQEVVNGVFEALAWEHAFASTVPTMDNEGSLIEYTSIDDLNEWGIDDE